MIVDMKYNTQYLKDNYSLVAKAYNKTLHKKFLESPHGLAFYMVYVNDSQAQTKISFDNFYNPALKFDSVYFNKVHKFTQCVEKNKDVDETQYNSVCRREWADLRGAVIAKQLMYHFVNRRFYMELLSKHKGEFPN